MTRLDGLACLVVEDEPLIAIGLCDLIGVLGGTVVASASRLQRGIEKASDLTIDIAFLDIDLGGLNSFPIAAVLRDRGIPFVFTSGHRGELSAKDHDVPILVKPYGRRSLLRAVEQAIVAD